VVDQHKAKGHTEVKFSENTITLYWIALETEIGVRRSRIIKFLSVLIELLALFCLEIMILSKNDILRVAMSEILE